MVNEFLHAPTDPDSDDWSLKREAEQAEEAGFEILRTEEELLDSIFYDIGVVVFYLKIIEWQIPGFDVNTYWDRLQAMHELIENQGAFHAKAHRYLIEAKK